MASQIDTLNDESYSLQTQVASLYICSGYCETAAGTAVKQVAVRGINTYTLDKADVINVLFNYDNTVAPASLQLKVGLSSARYIKTIINGQLVDLPSADVLKKNETYTFAYDGTY